MNNDINLPLFLVRSLDLIAIKQEIRQPRDISPKEKYFANVIAYLPYDMTKMLE